MHRQVNAIAGRLSLRPPQRHALERLDRVTEIVPPRKGEDLRAALAVMHSEFPTVIDFEREFPSICFALATGVGKTRLVGAFISYLHLAHGLNNFFVLAPNLTIYNKLITDFTPNTVKYVFKGIAEFATEPPEIITGEDYQYKAGTLFDQLLRVKINIFNISKINSEVRGGRAPRIKRLSEYIGESYFDYLAGRDDLVLLMDESHRYRASAGIRAINELKPVLGLELTATPFVETSRGTVQFKNVIYDYPLVRAMTDGFVKEPAVVTQQNFDPRQFTPAQLEEIKLQDGIRLHENTKVELETYARQTGQRIVKPFLLVIARDTAHASQLVQLMQSEQFFDGRYKDKVIQVDRDLLIQHLHTHEQETLSFSDRGAQEQRLEDYLVSGLMDFDDVSYDDHADLLYDLAGQMGKHLLGYLSEEDARNVLIYHQKQLVAFIHAQMQEHHWEKATGYDVVVSKGFTELKPSGFTTATTDTVHDFRQTVQERTRIAQMLFGGFQRCLYTNQKFQSDSERKLAIILDREALKWFKPARGKFQLYYKLGTDHLEYQPDFVAETVDCIYMLEAKARNDLHDVEVQSKKDAAVQWCSHATRHAVSNGGKPWQYLLIPHDVITENMTIVGLASQFRVD